ncbi:DUF2321 domain-containing protein [Clostridium sp.]|uniref:DUF2321 domain-containing protein n=1 Tax=Clostridium sp. TaxID=1506 RepID=UPI00283CA7C3|nr:DUF2321 domain-containing protein [Clostridium sp.]MDR3595147.1 DUF2321 domain-containing protein [Clostridium sp.]
MGYYETAQICENGHVITVCYPTDSGENYCHSCGSKTMTTCPSCDAQIRGKYQSDGAISITTKKNFPTPSFCYNCGDPYPWTKSALEATSELLQLESTLSAEELSYLNENMASILVDTPKTTVVATKLKIALGKAGSTAASAIKDILVDIASETAKKIIFPQQ